MKVVKSGGQDGRDM